jgi:hypothetical protein
MRRVLVLASATLAFVVGLAVPAATGASTPHLKVTPSTKLANSQIVRVSGSGFKPHDQVFIVQCQRTAKGQAGCAITNLRAATITASGVLKPTNFVVHTGKIGNGFCGTKAVNLAKCDISVGTPTGSDSATAPITFKLK